MYSSPNAHRPRSLGKWFKTATTMERFRLNKQIAVIHKQGEEPPAYIYWLSRSPEERLAAVEFLRQQYAGSEPRLQRVYRITQRS